MPDYQSNRFARKPFNNRGGGSDRFSSGPKQMFKADCAKCGSATEVPFRPNGKKPVYCSNCFVRDEEPRQYGPKREFTPRPSFNSAPPAAPRDDRSMQDIKSELKGVNDKLTKLIALMEYSQAAPAAEEKKPAKKAAAKKKK